MAIDSICTGCGRTLRVADEFEGRQARCPVCQTIYVVTRNNAIGDAPFGTLQPLSQNDSALADTTYQRSPVESNSSNVGSQSPVVTPAVSHVPSQSMSDLRYYVRTPNSATYGPADAATVLDWIAQGRLDDTCFVRNAAQNEWMDIPTWRSHQMMSTSRDPVSENPFSNSKQPNYQFGSVPVSGNQSMPYVKTGGGVVVLVLGIMSWVLCVTMVGGPVCAIIAVVLGRKELVSIREGKSAPAEKTLVITGMVFAILFLITFGSMIFLAVLGAVLNP